MSWSTDNCSINLEWWHPCYNEVIATTTHRWKASRDYSKTNWYITGVSKPVLRPIQSITEYIEIFTGDSASRFVWAICFPLRLNASSTKKD